MTATTAFPCQRCGMVLFQGNLTCPNCGALVYAQQLTDLARDAQREEETNPIRAAMIWQQALPLLPPESKQYQTIAQRIGILTSGHHRSAGAAMTPAERVAAAAAAARPEPRNDTLPLALAKTIGSMLVSILVYTLAFGAEKGLVYGLQFATGFVLLMLVHELGHSMAVRYYGLKASPPIFIPFLGAVISLRQPPRNALEEAVVGIGGPVTGTIAAGVTYLIYLKTGSELFLRLAEFGFLLNLFNMLPVPPLDGGRVTAAVSPWVWIPGLLGAIALMVRDFSRHGQINPIFILLVLMALPRVLRVLNGGYRNEPYYQIGRRAKWAMGIAYVVLGVALWVMFELCKFEAKRHFGGGWFG